MASVVNITNAVGNGTTATYTYTLVSGPQLKAGIPIIITGCVTAGFNGNFLINGGNFTTTFTVANGTNHASEAETAQGISDLEGNSMIPTLAGGALFGYGAGGRFLAGATDGWPTANVPLGGGRYLIGSVR